MAQTPGNLTTAPLKAQNNLSDLPAPGIAAQNMGFGGAAQSGLVGFGGAGQYAISASGWTYDIPVGQTNTIFTGSGAVTGATINLPSAALSGIPYQFMSTVNVATVTVSGSVGVSGTTLTALAANTAYTFVLNSDWFRVQ